MPNLRNDKNPPRAAMAARSHPGVLRDDRRPDSQENTCPICGGTNEKLEPCCSAHVEAHGERATMCGTCYGRVHFVDWDTATPIAEETN